MPSVQRVQTVARLFALAALLLLGVEDADARPSAGWRFDGGSVFLISPSAGGSIGAAAATPVTHRVITAQVGLTPYPGGSLIGLFKRGNFLGGFAAGFLGSGVLGLLFGLGLTGGLVGAASYLGLLFQLALLAALVRLIWTRWRGGNARGATALSPRQLADVYFRSPHDLHAGADLPDLDDAAAGDDSASKGSKPATRNGER